MSNKARRKGTDAEMAVLHHLEARFPGIYRPAQAGALDRGDLIIPRHWVSLPDGGSARVDYVIEVKNRRDYAAGVREGLRQLDAEKQTVGTAHGALVSKVRGKGLGSVGEWHVTRLLRDDPILGDL